MDSNSLLQQYQQFTQGRANPLDLYNKAGDELGVKDVRQNVGNLRTSLLNTENLLNGVEGSVTGRTQGSLVTEAQRQRLVNLERQPVMQQYSKLSDSYGNETANLRDLLGQASQKAQLGYQADSDKGNSLLQLFQSAQSKEAEARRQQEADRAFQEQQRQFNEQMNYNKSQAAAARSSAASSVPSANATALKLLTDWATNNKPAWYTEQSIIPQIAGAYGMNKDAAAKLVYDLRKQYFNE